jgi:hypothetical protein
MSAIFWVECSAKATGDKEVRKAQFFMATALKAPRSTGDLTMTVLKITPRPVFHLKYRFQSRKRRAFRMASSGMLRRVALVRTDVSEELSASIIRVTRIREQR